MQNHIVIQALYEFASRRHIQQYRFGGKHTLQSLLIGFLYRLRRIQVLQTPVKRRIGNRGRAPVYAGDLHRLGPQIIGKPLQTNINHFYVTADQRIGSILNTWRIFLHQDFSAF